MSARPAHLLSVLLCLFPLVQAQVASPQRTWIFFRDKGVVPAYTAASLGITDRAVKRRAKVLPPSRLIDELDLPVANDYLHQLQTIGVTIRSTSRWLNAASVEATSAQLAMIAQQSFVASVARVGTQTRPMPEFSSVPATLSKTQAGAIDYGLTLTQHTRTRVIDVHALGITGAGVLLGFEDDGFNYHTTHAALKNIPVVAEYDFVQRDNNTSIASGEYAGQGNHGAHCLSIAAGFANGSMIGAAFGVSVVLAKTEIDSVEIHLEEDNYVEALEWMERLGVDIVSTSLGYDDFDPYRDDNKKISGYNPDDIFYRMKDGKTAKTSKAAAIAARKGVLLVTAMGNENWYQRDSTWLWSHRTDGVSGSLVTPADADSIISVGAVNSTGMLAGFSSTGPTADGRTKPEVVNQGVTVYHVVGAASGVGYGDGTSYATPLTAGAAALVLSAHPELTPMQVREALMSTARRDVVVDSRIGTLVYPNNYYGWGHVNAYDATLYWGLVFSNTPTLSANDTAYIISTKIKSKSTLNTDSLALFHRTSGAASFQRARLIPTGVPDEFAAYVKKSELDVSSVGYFVARDTAARRSPYNAPDSLFALSPLLTSVRPSSREGAAHGATAIPKDFQIACYPNPFNPSTNVVVELPMPTNVEAAVFNMLGQRVRTLYRGVATAGTHAWHWDGVDESGAAVAGGVYFVRLATEARVLTAKIVLLK